MKTNLILICYFVLISGFSQLKEGRAIYNVKTSINFQNIESENDKQVLKKIFNETEQVSKTYFELLFNKKESIFYGYSQLIKNENKIDLVNINAKIIGSVYVNLSEGEVIQKKEKFGETFLVNFKTDSFEWELINESIKFGDYTCFKAVLKNQKQKRNKTIEWYTPDIQFQFGPLGYSGLPGFIILLKDDIFIYSLGKVRFSLTDREKKKIRKPKKGIKVTRSEYDSIYRVMTKEEY